MKKIKMLIIKWFINFYRGSIDLFVFKLSKKIKKSLFLLDAGAGECRYKSLFSHVSYKAADFCDGDTNWNYSNIDYNCLLDNIPIENDKVEHILCTQTLEHVPEPDKVISEFNRILKKDGELYLTFPFLGDPHHQEPYDFFRYSKYGITHLLEKNNFEVKEIKPIGGGYFMLLARLIIKGMYFDDILGTSKNIFFRILRKLRYLIFIPLYTLINGICFLLDKIFYRKSYKYAIGFMVTAKKK